MFEAIGKKSYRIILLVVLLMFSAAGTLYGVWCYSSAEVNSEAEMSIVPSEEALIAVDIVDAISITQGEKGLIGKVTNNTAESVELTIISTFAGSFIYNPPLAPGVFTDLELEIPVDVPPEEYLVEGIAQARWAEGSAEIGFELMVTVLPVAGLTGEGLAPAGSMLFDSSSGTSGEVPGTAGAAGSGNGDGSESAAGTSSDTGEFGGDEPVAGGEDGSSANGASEGTAAPGGDAGESGSGDATGTESGTGSGGSDASSGDSGPSSDSTGGAGGPSSEGDSSSESSTNSGSDASADTGDAGDSVAGA